MPQIFTPFPWRFGRILLPFLLKNMEKFGREYTPLFKKSKEILTLLTTLASNYTLVHLVDKIPLVAQPPPYLLYHVYLFWY